MPDLSDANMRFSPQSSLSSPSSPEGRDADDDESLSINYDHPRLSLTRKISPPFRAHRSGSTATITSAGKTNNSSATNNGGTKLMSKSVTENFLCNVAASSATTTQDGNNNLHGAGITSTNNTNNSSRSIYDQVGRSHNTSIGTGVKNGGMNEDKSFKKTTAMTQTQGKQVLR